MGSYAMCEHKYFLQYNLGLQEASGKKALQGTIAHKVYQWLSMANLNFNDKEIRFIDDSSSEEVIIDPAELYKTEVLSNDIVDEINKTRRNKGIYKNPCQIEYGHIRTGYKAVNELIKRSFEYYSRRNTHHEWTITDLKNCGNFVWLALETGTYDPRNMKIVASECPFDLPIIEPWAEYEQELNGEKISGTFAIKGTIDLITEVDSDTLEIVDLKGLPVDTPIPTPNGWTTMGDLVIGSEAFDEDGKITRVINKSKKTIKKCYKIKFDDKTEVICDEDHLWKLNTGEIKGVLDLKPRDKINITKPLEIPEIELPIDPYVLGIWLGDGRNRNGEVSKDDMFIFEEMERRGYQRGPNIEKREGFCPIFTIYGLVTKLKIFDLLYNKHIPSIYLRASYKQRLDLLRGLMDSDGSANTIRKQGVFSNCEKRLSEDVKELLISLGQRPNLCKVKQTGFGLTVDSYPVHFKPLDINPFLLPRKADKVNSKWGRGNSWRRLIKKIEYVGEMETQCITVDSPTHTYLCTKNMIPTHNTGQRLNWASGKVKSYDDLCKDQQLMLYYYAARRLYPQYKHILVTILFVRDGGAYTISLDDNSIQQVESDLRAHFEEIKANRLPKMLHDKQSDFRCTKLCDYYKKSLPGTSVNICRHINNELKRVGMDEVIKQYKDPSHQFDHYSSPGE